jgi:hypothetical protein
MDLHIPSIEELAAFAVQFPVVAVLVAGVLFGTGLTQLVKKTYLVYMPIAKVQVSIERYTVTTRWLSVLSTYCFSLWLWHAYLQHTGGEEVLCLGTAFLSPLLYDWTRALVAWKFPALTANWGRPSTPKE